MEKRGKKRAIVSVNGKKRNEERGWNRQRRRGNKESGWNSKWKGQGRKEILNRKRKRENQRQILEQLMEKGGTTTKSEIVNGEERNKERDWNS